MGQSSLTSDMQETAGKLKCLMWSPWNNSDDLSRSCGGKEGHKASGEFWHLAQTLDFPCLLCRPNVRAVYGRVKSSFFQNTHHGCVNRTLLWL